MSTSRVAGNPRGLYFFHRFLRNPREVGAVCPSTKHLGRAMLDGLELAPGDLIVEYGPGTGAFTRVIQERIDEVGDVDYLGIEREPGFCDILRERLPQLEFVNGRVEDTPRLLRERGLGPPRAIVSGLPLIFMPAMPQIVAQASELLEAGGSFRTFSYLQSYVTRGARRLRATMRARFDRFSMSRLVVRNFPPAFVLRGDRD